MIRVKFRNGRDDEVSPQELDSLITANKLKSFRRSSGWVEIGRDRIRGLGGRYNGPERRVRGASFSWQHTDASQRQRIRELEEKVALLKKEKETAQAQRNQFKAILASSNDLLALKGPDHVYRAVNQAFCEFLGKTETEVVGSTDFDIFPRTQAEHFHSSDAEVLSLVRPSVQDVEVPGKNGKRWFQLTRSPVFDDRGSCIGILCSATDISERMQADEDMEWLNAELQEVLVIIKKLSGYLVVCSSCRKLKNGKGNWYHFETYFRKYLAIRFTHGICPSCAKNLYPDLYQE